MPKRAYKIGRSAPGSLDTPVVEFTGSEGDESPGRVVLALYPPASHTNAVATVEALRKAYEAGRDDRSDELLQLPGDNEDWLLDAVRARLLGCMEEWGQGTTDPVGPDGIAHWLALVRVVEANGELYFEVSPDRYHAGRRLRIRLLIEDSTAPRELTKPPDPVNQ